MSFRSVIQQEVERQGLSGYRIAILANMPRRTVQAYLSGTRDLTGERLAKIADALGLELRPKRQPAQKE